MAVRVTVGSGSRARAHPVAQGTSHFHVMSASCQILRERPRREHAREVQVHLQRAGVLDLGRLVQAAPSATSHSPPIEIGNQAEPLPPL